jgi:maleamate amidohydrolase
MIGGRCDSAESAADIYRRQNIGGRLGFGSHCAVLVVDFVNGFADPNVLGGGNIASAIAATSELLRQARLVGVPVVFTRIVYGGQQAYSVFCRKMPSLAALTEDNPLSAIVPQLQVLAGDLVVRKTQPSAFFGTDLAGYLVSRGVDTVLTTGCTTSGCVRASVVDAMSHNFRPIVVQECVGDRALEPHNASLFDMTQKYADVVPLAAVMSHLETLQPRSPAHNT